MIRRRRIQILAGVLSAAAVTVTLILVLGDESSSPPRSASSKERASTAAESCLRSWNETSSQQARFALTARVVTSGSPQVYVGPYEGSAQPYESGVNDAAGGRDEPDGQISAGDCWLLWDSRGV